MANKLFIVFKVEFHPSVNQDMLGEVAEAVKERMWDLFDLDDEGQPIPAPKDITHELVIEVLDESRCPKCNSDAFLGLSAPLMGLSAPLKGKICPDCGLTA